MQDEPVPKVRASPRPSMQPSAIEKFYCRDGCYLIRAHARLSARRNGPPVQTVMLRVNCRVQVRMLPRKLSLPNGRNRSNLFSGRRLDERGPPQLAFLLAQHTLRQGRIHSKCLKVRTEPVLQHRACKAPAALKRLCIGRKFRMH